ncbi:MAG: AzlD domain-containing protein [Alphaproteobacteria bacterium]|nr:AzlD domain-containing protein [Alphaproteobacteria bacterium]
MIEIVGPVWPYLALTCAAVATYAFRGLGVAFAGRLRTDSPWFDLASCVAYALLAGLLARMILIPQGALAEAPLVARCVAVGAALLVFVLVRRLLPAVLAGAITVVVLTELGI